MCVKFLRSSEPQAFQQLPPYHIAGLPLKVLALAS